MHHRHLPSEEGDSRGAQLLMHQPTGGPVVDSLMPKRREVWDHAKFDIDLLEEIPNVRTMKNKLKFKVEIALATWILFNAVSTLMIITTNMKRAVPHERIAQFGEAKFDALMWFIVYFPLVYFFLLFFLINNYYSELTFYHYLRRGAIVDYPPSDDWSFMLKRPGALLVILSILSYAGISYYTMFYFKASIGTILIFSNNLLIGVGMFWFRQQSIEWKFVSISDFIQAFPDRTNSYGNIDEVSLHRASEVMDHLTVTESQHPSYSNYMRIWWWKNQNYSGTQQIMHHVGMFLLVGALIGLAFGYFFIQGRLDLESRWDNEINPCIRGCVVGGLNATNGNFDVTGAFCSWCTCQCLDFIRMRDLHTLRGCGDYFSGGAACPGAGESCPSTCGFEKR